MFQSGGGVSSKNSRGGSYGFGGPAFAAPGMAYTKCLYHPEIFFARGFSRETIGLEGRCFWGVGGLSKRIYLAEKGLSRASSTQFWWAEIVRGFP